MSNRSDPLSGYVNGRNGQSFVGEICKSRIYDSVYWKEHCFGLNEEMILEKAAGLDHIGGLFGGNYKATPFICLLLKLLQIGPSREIVDVYVQQNDFKYLRALAAFYIRLTFKPHDAYRKIEELYIDHRLLRIRNLDSSFSLIHMDEFADDLLRAHVVLGIDMPRLPPRYSLEASIGLKLDSRSSALWKYFEKLKRENGVAVAPRLAAAGIPDPDPPCKELLTFDSIPLPSISTHAEKEIWIINR